MDHINLRLADRRGEDVQYDQILDLAEPMPCFPRLNDSRRHPSRSVEPSHY